MEYKHLALVDFDVCCRIKLSAQRIVPGMLPHLYSINETSIFCTLIIIIEFYAYSHVSIHHRR